MTETDILKWAAGAEIELPRFEGLTDDRILALLDIDEANVGMLLERHRLEGRFLRRYQQERPAWCSGPLLTRMVNQSNLVYQRTHRQIAAFREIAGAVANRQSPLVSFKGFTSYALTGEYSLLRLSGDIDLLYDDAEYLWETMLGLGYTGEKYTDAYEFAAMYREDIKIEIHRHILISDYPEGLCRTDLLPEHNPGCWQQNRKPSIQRDLHYDDLRGCLACGLTPETAGLYFPDPTLSVFIYCTHLFKHFATSSWIEAPCALKLVELADIRDLAHHPSFDRGRFEALVSRFSAQAAVCLVSRLAEAFLGIDPLETLSFSSENEAAFPFPRRLLAWGGWALVDSIENIEDILLPLDLHQANKVLGDNTVMAPRCLPLPVYTLDTEEPRDKLERVLSLTPPGRSLPLRIEALWTESLLRFDLTFLRTFPEDISCESAYSIALYYHRAGREQDVRGTLVQDATLIGGRGKSIRVERYSYVGPQPMSVENHILSDVEIERHHYRLSFCLTKNVSPRDAWRKGALPLLLVLFEAQDLPKKGMQYDPILLLPLTIIREGECP